MLEITFNKQFFSHVFKNVRPWQTSASGVDKIPSHHILSHHTDTFFKMSGVCICGQYLFSLFACL